MVSTQQKIVAAARKKKAAQAAGAASSAFNQRQSAFARKAEEERVRSERAGGGGGGDGEEGGNAFDRARGRSAVATKASGPMSKGPSRRSAKYALEEVPDAGAIGHGGLAAATPESDFLGSLLGSANTTGGAGGAGFGGFGNGNDQDGDDDGAPDLKKQRKERFEDVITSSRRTRADLQKERDERNKATDALDSEFDAVAHLLSKRDKRQEEVDAFATLGRPDVRRLLTEHAEQRAATAGRKFVLGAGGNLERIGLATDDVAAATPEAAKSSGKKGSAAAAAEAAKPVAVSPKAAPAKAPPAAAAAAATAAPAVVDLDGAGDDFDAMMGSFKMELRRAHAVDRVLLPEEEAARDVQQQLLQMDREHRPHDDRDRVERTRGEWIAEGGDAAYAMDADDALAGQSAPLAAGRGDGRQGHAVDVLLGKVEAFCAAPPETAAERSEALSALASELWHAAVKQKKHAEESFKLILIDCQRCIYRQRPLTRFHSVALYLAAKVFPTTDFRHTVVTPLMILLCSLCMQTRLTSVANCRSALWYAGLLLHILAPSQRYASEPVTVALNVIALQVARRQLVPETHGTSRGAFPVLDRSPDALLALDGCDAGATARPLPLVGDLDAAADEDSSSAAAGAGASPQERLDTVAAAYRLLLNAAELYHDSPSFACIFETSFVLSFHRILRAAKVHPAVEGLHRKVLERVAMLAAENAMTRTPLAMRTFRPRPLRMYEPMLGDDTPSDKKELQILKKEHRADHKRIVRTLTAEAKVEQRARDSERAAVDARKQAKLNSLMAELQQQQHIMKTADNLKTKASMRKKATINAAATSGAGKKRSSD